MTASCAVIGCPNDADYAVHLPESWFPLCLGHAQEWADDPTREVQAVGALPEDDQ